jgi:uncharacterized protein (DUF885 family)
MGETDFLTPLERYSQHQSRLRMAARAVADAALHTGRMSFDEVVALYRDEAGMSAAAARSEAVKNSMNPAAALMYLLGTDLIHELRRDLVGETGMTLLEFHDRLLSFGSAPVQLVADRMRESAGQGA